MGKHLKQGMNLVFKLGLASALIWWFIHKGLLNVAAVSVLMQPLPATLLVSFALAMVIINNVRWLILLNAQGVQTTFMRTLELSLIGLFFNYAMPGGVGGDVVKGYYLLHDHPQQRVAGAMSIFMDRMIGFCVMIFTAAGALAFNWARVRENPQFKALAFAVFLLSLCFCLFFAIALSKRIYHWPFRRKLVLKLPLGATFEKIYLQLHAYRSVWPRLLAAFLISFVSQFFLIISVYFIAWWTNATELHLIDCAFLVPLGTVVTALPISPGGIGVGQAAFYFLFNLYLGHQTNLGPLAATALQMAQLACGFIGAGLYLRRKSPPRPNPQVAADAS